MLRVSILVRCGLWVPSAIIDGNDGRKIIFFVPLPVEMKFRRASPGMGFLEPVQVLVFVCFQKGT